MHRRTKICLMAAAVGVALVASAPAGSAAQTPAGDNTTSPGPEAFEVDDMAADLGISRQEAERRLKWEQAGQALAASAQAELGAEFAGYYIDGRTGRPTIAVTTGSGTAGESRARRVFERAGLADAGQVTRRAEGARARQTRIEDLGASLRDVNAGASSPLLVEVDEASGDTTLLVPQDATERQRRWAEADPSAGKLPRRTAATRIALQSCNSSGLLHCGSPARGGTHFSSTYSGKVFACTYGFLAQSKSDTSRYFITAGHCFDGAPGGLTVNGFNASDVRTDYGPLHRVGFEGDYAIVRHANALVWNPRPVVAVLDRADTSLDLTYYIASDAPPAQSSRACFTGGRSRTSDCGTFGTAVWDGSQYLQRIDYCGAMGGDSGGSVFASHAAIGLHIGQATDASNNLIPCNYFVKNIQSAELELNVNVVHGTS
jgi:hypothetical protein